MSDRYVWEKFSLTVANSSQTSINEFYVLSGAQSVVASSSYKWNVGSDGRATVAPSGNTAALNQNGWCDTGIYTYIAAEEYLLIAPSGKYWGRVRPAYVEMAQTAGGATGLYFGRSSGIISRGTSLGYVASANSSAYPNNAASGGYWYVYKGNSPIDAKAVVYSTKTPVGGETITITVTPSDSSYGTISYQYQYSINNGSTWTNIDSPTTSTSKTFTIPSSATQFKARVRASDNMGFTSTDYVTGENLTVTEPTATYTISLTSSSGGTVSGGGTYEEGTSVTVRATASSGYRFSRWTEDGTTVSTSSSYTFTVTKNRTLRAVFSVIPPSYSITVTASPTTGGTVSGGGSYESGKTATVRATPAADFLFVEWQEDGASVSSNPAYSFTVSKARNLTAVFKRKLSAYVGIDGKARKATDLYVGIEGKARKIIRAYVGVDGKAQKFL